MFSEEKATSLGYVLVHLANGAISHVKLMKLMYLTEREWLRQKGVTITGDSFVNMDQGPVLSRTYDCMKRNTTPHMLAASGNVWRQYLTPVDNRTIQEVNGLDANSVLTPKQMEVVNAIWAEHGHKTEEELVEETHRLPEWVNPHGSVRPLDMRLMFMGLDVPDDEIDAKVNRLIARQRLDGFFASAS